MSRRERRLAYVAITRAEERLHLTYASTPRLVCADQPAQLLSQRDPEADVTAIGGFLGLTGVGWAKAGDRHGTWAWLRAGARRSMCMSSGSRTRSTGGGLTVQRSVPIRARSPLRRSRASAPR